jgi:hypothetical protein
MSVRLEETLTLARSYQLPHWQYFSLPQLDPYRLAAQGYRCSAPLTLQCAVCRHTVRLPEDADDRPPADIEDIEASLAAHDEACLYHKATPYHPTASDIYMGLSSILEEMEALPFESSLPLLNSRSLWQFIGSDAFLVKKVFRLYGIDPERLLISFVLRMLGWHLVGKEGKDSHEPCLRCYYCGATRPLAHYAASPQDTHDPALEQGTAAG